MISFPVKKLETASRGLSQKTAISLTANGGGTSGPRRPVVFTRTLAASQEGRILYRVGTGQVDPTATTRILLQVANDEGVPFSVIRKELVDTWYAFAHDPENWKVVAATMMAVAVSRPIISKNTVRATPKQIFNAVQSRIPRVRPVIQHIIADAATMRFHKLNLIYTDRAYVYQLESRAIYPTFDALVDSVDALSVEKIIHAMIDFDVSMYESALKKKDGSISPSQLANDLADSMVTAYDRLANLPEPQEMVVLVLTLLSRLWSPSTPDAVKPSERLRNAPELGELLPNLGLFLAYQDMPVKFKNKSVAFADESMLHYTLPTFMKALTTITPFVIRAVSDTVAHIGKHSVVNHQSQPTNVCIYEDYSSDQRIDVFQTLRAFKDGNGHYLQSNTDTTATLNGAMSQVGDVFTMADIINSRQGGAEIREAPFRMGAEGCNVDLIFPSLYTHTQLSNSQLESIDDKAFLISELVERHVIDGKKANTSNNLLDMRINAKTNDIYQMMIHLAVASPYTTIYMTGKPNALRLVFRVDTKLKYPIGRSAILYSVVETIEPVEALMYVPDFSPTTSIQFSSLNVTDFQDDVHIWNVFTQTNRLQFDTIYTTKFRNETMSVDLNESTILGRASRDSRLRSVPAIGSRALVQLVFTTLMNDIRSLRERAETDTVDSESESSDVYKLTLAARSNALLIAFVHRLSMIGTSSMGAEIKSIVTTDLASQMHDKGVGDFSNDFHHGHQDHRLTVWTGITILQLLGLLNKVEAEAIGLFLKENEAIAMTLGIQLSKLGERLAR